jgi:hypothetical protein
MANSHPTVPLSGALDFTIAFKWGSCYSIFSFMYDVGKYCERSRTKYDWTVEKFTEMTDWQEHEYM